MLADCQSLRILPHGRERGEGGKSHLIEGDIGPEGICMRVCMCVSKQRTHCADSSTKKESHLHLHEVEVSRVYGIFEENIIILCTGT